MWTRRELKERGKQAMRLNYWKTVLVSVILMILLGGVVGGSGASSAASSAAAGGSTGSSAVIVGEADTDIDHPPIDMNGALTGGDSSEPTPEEVQGVLGAAQEIFQNIGTLGTIALLATVFLVILVIVAVVVVMQALLLNPLEVGGSRFFLRNLNTKAEVKELAFAYDHGYLNVVKTIFFRDLYTILWSLLFIIPGIVKAYEYRMMPYILAEHPEMATREVFAQSRDLMRGQKWKSFVLDLSFIGWGILSLLTLGILGVFYVNPYRNMTNAALYEKLMYGMTPELAEAEM